MKLKTLLLVVLTATLFCLFSTTVAFADETPAPAEGVETEQPIEETPSEQPTEEPVEGMTDEQLDKLVEQLKGFISSNTNISEESIDGISGKIYEWLDGKVSESIIALVIIAIAIVIIITVVLLKGHFKSKTLNAQLGTVTAQYNNLVEFLETYKGDKVKDGVAEEVKNYLSTVKLTDERMLAEIKALTETVLSATNSQTKAMQLTWGNKVQGVNSALAESPTQSTVNAQALYIKKLEETVKSVYNEDADKKLVEIQKQAGI